MNAPMAVESAEGTLTDLLVALGVSEGETVFVHADLRRLGMMRGPGGDIRLAVSAETLLDALRSVVGSRGTIVVPTYASEWSPDVRFDPATSAGAMGAFSELVRQQPGAVRTGHPLLSVAALGPDATRLLGGVDESGYGADSPHARLLAADARMIMVGVPLCSFKDHIEWRLRVPYRYEKIFETGSGQIFRHNVRYRYEGRSVGMTTFLGGLTADEHAVLTGGTWAKGEIHAVAARDMFASVAGILERDPFRFVTDDLGFRREMTFLRDLEAAGTRRRVRHTPDGEIWEWAPAESERMIRVGGKTPGAEICLRAAREILSDTEAEVSEPSALAPAFFARLAEDARP